MANTVIQIKRSSVTTAPSAGSLSAAEPAYSYLSDKLFLGSSDGSQVIEIGGRFYINSVVRAENTANQANVIAVAAYDKANAANVLAYNSGIGSNAYADAVGAGANAYMIAVQNGSNTAVGSGANSFASATIAGANSAVGTGANNFAAATIAGANAAVGTGANNYTNANFVKLVAGNQTITGNLAVTGSLTVSGNAYTIDSQTLVVSDPLIYLAANNYVSDIVDIGFVANYVSGNGQNLHTGIFRDATIKEYYVFEGYNQEPNVNHIDTAANGFSLAVLNATLRTSNLILGGINAFTLISNSSNGANAFAAATIAGANSAVGGGANAFAAATISGSNTFFTNTIAGANTAVGAGANAWANGVWSRSNTYMTATVAGANTAVGAGANAWANVVWAASNTYMTATIAGANTAVGGGANAFAAATIAGANSYLLAVIAGANSAVGAGANSYASNATNINTGTLRVAYGGTGVNSFTNNGILFGNTTNALRVTAAGTEGNVLQVNNQGTPFFGMLDGGTF